MLCAVDFAALDTFCAFRVRGEDPGRPGYVLGSRHLDSPIQSIEVLRSSVPLSLEQDLAVYEAYFLAMAQDLGIPFTSRPTGE